MYPQVSNTLEYRPYVRLRKLSEKLKWERNGFDGDY